MESALGVGIIIFVVVTGVALLVGLIGLNRDLEDI
jgi:hypothetical protein